MKILLIDNYDSFTFNLYHYLSTYSKVDVIRNDMIDSSEILKKKYKKIPIFGVCLGHQIIGQCFGSKIIQAKKLMHGKTSLIKHNNKGIMKNIKNNFEATRYHSLIIDSKTLSKDLLVTSKSSDGIIMGIMHKKYNIHGVQFHPESIKTSVGMKIIKNFVNI